MNAGLLRQVFGADDRRSKLVQGSKIVGTQRKQSCRRQRVGVVQGQALLLGIRVPSDIRSVLRLRIAKFVDIVPTVDSLRVRKLMIYPGCKFTDVARQSGNCAELVTGRIRLQDIGKKEFRGP